MPAKKSSAKPKYFDLIVSAIKANDSRKGTSQPAIEKFIKENHPDFEISRPTLRNTLKRNIESGRILVHHQHKNSYKLPTGKPAKADAAPAEKKAKKATAEKKGKAAASPAKKGKKAAGKKAAKAPEGKLTHWDLVKLAIKESESRKGVSKPAIEKFIQENHPSFNFSRATLRNTLKAHIKNGELAPHHNHPNSYKFPPKKPAAEKKPAAKKPAAKKPAAKKPAAKAGKAKKSKA